MWTDTSASGDFCYVGEGACSVRSLLTKDRLVIIMHNVETPIDVYHFMLSPIHVNVMVWDGVGGIYCAVVYILLDTCVLHHVPPRHSLFYTSSTSTFLVLHLIHLHIPCFTPHPPPHSLFYTSSTSTFLVLHLIHLHIRCFTRHPTSTFPVAHLIPPHDM